MNECVICGKDSGKGKTCSPAHRKAYQRQLASVTKSAVEPSVTLSVTGSVTSLIENFGEPDCQCTDCKLNRLNGNRHTINHGAWKPDYWLGHNELNRTPLPGDPDYKSKCKATAEYNTGIDQIRIDVA